MANQIISSSNLNGAASSGLTRERSFVRTSHANKRRSLAIQLTNNEVVDNMQNRSKPALEIYRPPSNSLKMNEVPIIFSNDLNFLSQILVRMEHLKISLM